MFKLHFAETQVLSLWAMPMITYSAPIQTGLFVVALVGLCYKIFKNRK